MSAFPHHIRSTEWTIPPMELIATCMAESPIQAIRYKDTTAPGCGGSVLIVITIRTTARNTHFSVLAAFTAMRPTLCRNVNLLPCNWWLLPGR